MAQFRAVIRGQRGEASRLGNKKSGLTAVVNGWDSGVRVEAWHVDNADAFHVYATKGSNNNGPTVYLGYVDAVGGWHPAKARESALPDHLFLATVEAAKHGRALAGEKEYVVQGNYGQGWEDVYTGETKQDALDRLNEYRRNEPYSFRLTTRKGVA